MWGCTQSRRIPHSHFEASPPPIYSQLRFARWVTPQDARLASGCWPDSTGWALWPTGFLRKVSSMLPTSLPSFPRLPLAQARVGREVRSRIDFNANLPRRVGPTQVAHLRFVTSVDPTEARNARQ